MSDRTKNVGNGQMLADRLMPHVKDCRTLSRNYKDTVAYILSQDNDYHALLKERTLGYESHVALLKERALQPFKVD